ncbi:MULTISPECIES: SRPBCC family protein [Halocynthiibacter]|uniref:SRPBCC family protein n=1 Tax=Halocynthiibacter halioticoli TaxID=2986804 RepID=A0AAE3IWB7_9RHOB|nr:MULTISPECIES: SRPBCC family protein [Halocynthiibacter]MCV6823330.1 SRPBCC family protein [Halocynthiibacter halioticoli]MCW4056331.1 SRPBCC family protein [Halocynthiibacter sp. SDUM655004]
MKLESREDIEAPLSVVFQAVSDFPAFERLAFRRGIDVGVETGDPEKGEPERSWDAKFNYRGRDRRLKAALVRIDPAQGYLVNGAVGGLEGDMIIDLVPLSRTRTRLTVCVDTRAKSLTARLLLQTAKLTRAKIYRRFRRRVGQVAQDIEDRYNAMSPS